VRNQRNLNKNRVQNDIGREIFDEKAAQKIKELFPNLEISGKQDELYKMREVLDHIKDTQGKTYDDLSSLNKHLIKIMNHKHNSITCQGNKALNKNSQFDDHIYCAKTTASYINVKCNVSKKCRFAMWYKYDKNS
jgi:hypothetical protein